MPVCLIGLGSNLGDRRGHLESAVAKLAQHAEVTVHRSSQWYETSPAGGPDQGPYLNGAACIETTLSAEQLLALLQQIENDAGRGRGERWGPRELDLDLLLYGEEVIHTGVLMVPHPRMVYRRFVLEPAVEVAAELLHPLTGRTVAQLLEQLNQGWPYVAIAGLPGVGQHALGERIAADHAGRLLQYPGSFASGDSASHFSTAAFERAVSDCAVMLAKPEEAEPILWVSDFWFDQLLVDAALSFADEPLERAHQVWSAAHGEVLAPKLVLYLHAPAEWIRAHAASPRTEEELECYRAAIGEYAGKRGAGPVVPLDASEERFLEEEVRVAIDALQ